MKPTPPYFENVSHSEAEKRIIAKFKLLHEKDDPKLTLKLILTFFISGALAIALICAIIINAHYIDKIPAWGWTLFTLVFIALAIGILIVRSAKNSLKNPEKDY